LLVSLLQVCEDRSMLSEVVVIRSTSRQRNIYNHCSQRKNIWILTLWENPHGGVPSKITLMRKLENVASRGKNWTELNWTELDRSVEFGSVRATSCDDRRRPSQVLDNRRRLSAVVVARPSTVIAIIGQFTRTKNLRRPPISSPNRRRFYAQRETELKWTVQLSSVLRCALVFTILPHSHRIMNPQSHTGVQQVVQGAANLDPRPNSYCGEYNGVIPEPYPVYADNFTTCSTDSYLCRHPNYSSKMASVDK